MRKPDVQLDRDTPINQQEQLEAAATVWAYKAAQILHARQAGNLNEVPDSEWFTQAFTFSREELRGYIESQPELVPYLLNSSLDQRGGFYSLFMETPSGYVAGYYDHDRQKTKVFDNPLDAATDYVLLHWRMIPLEGSPPAPPVDPFTSLPERTNVARDMLHNLVGKFRSIFRRS